MTRAYSRVTGTWLAVVLALLPGWAAQPVPRFTLTRADGHELEGTLEAIKPGWAITLGGTDQVPGAQVIALSRRGQPRPPRPLEQHLLLAGGDLVPGLTESLTGETLRFTPALGSDQTPEWKLPLSAVSVIWLALPDGAASVEALERQLASTRRVRDLVYLRNGDILEGILLSLDRKNKLKIEVKGRELAVEFSKVAVIALNTDLQRVPKTKQPHGHVVLGNGARLELASLRADDRNAQGKTIYGTSVAFPISDLVALEPRGGRATYLSDLKPTAYQFTPFLDQKWSYVNDGSVMGKDLRLGGNVYDKGIGLHAAAQLTYTLPAGSRLFQALVGLDERSGRAGSARIEILVDGKARKLDWDGTLAGGTPPHTLQLDVKGARELTLKVDFGPRGNVQAHVDFAQARLIK